MKRKWAGIILVGLFCFAYTGCGSTKAFGAVNSTVAVAPDTYYSESAQETADALTGADTTTVTVPQDDRKIIYDATIELESTDFAGTQQALSAACEAAGGYIAGTELSHYQSERRSATMHFRIPAESYAGFLQALGQAGNVVSQIESTEDVTAQYVDVQARIDSLKLQEERLIVMMGEAGDLDTLLAIQNQLTEVQYQLESYTAQQRTLQDLVSYSSVTVNVQEVGYVTEQQDTFASRIGAAFRDSWRSFGTGCQDFAVWFVGALPAFLVLAVLACAVLLVIRALIRNAAKRRAAAPHRTPVAYDYAAPSMLQNKGQAGEENPASPVVPHPAYAQPSAPKAGDAGNATGAAETTGTAEEKPKQP